MRRFASKQCHYSLTGYLSVDWVTALVVTSLHYNRLTDHFTTLIQRAVFSAINYAGILVKGCSACRRPPQPVAWEQRVACDKSLTEIFSVKTMSFAPFPEKSGNITPRQFLKTYDLLIYRGVHLRYQLI